MNISIRSIVDAGNIEKERLILDVHGAIDLGDYALFRSPYLDDSVLAWVHNAFWFPDEEMEDGDIVVVYSKCGNNSKRKESGSTIFFFYWDQDRPIWSSDSSDADSSMAPYSVPVVVQIRNWIMKTPEELGYYSDD